LKNLNTIYTTAMIAALWIGSCGTGTEPAGGEREPQPGPVSGAPTQHKARVASIVFVGQKDACSCDRERIDKVWQALQGVLGQGKNVAVKRLQIDVDDAETDIYDDMRPIMVLPGLYFLDDKGELVELLQGEVDERKIVELL
jgi:hypothetical protein